MAAYVDTNILVRHLTGDPPGMARRATAYLATEDDLILTAVVVAETVYVLGSFYKVPRAEIATAVRSLLAFEKIRCTESAVLGGAVDIYETYRIDFAEAYLAAAAEVSGIRRVASFDQAIDRVTGVVRIEPR